MTTSSPRRIELAGTGLVLACLSAACEPELVVGKRLVDELGCSPPDPSGAAGAGSDVITVPVPWLTGFENSFCDYFRVGGRCYNDPDASYRIVDEPVHGGRSAAAFSVTSAVGTNGVQTRCFLEDSLPVDARYGAWFYVPALAVNTGNWNLMYFQGRARSAPGPLHGLWDVSLGNSDDGSLHLYVFDHLGAGVTTPNPTRAVPIAAWFHVEVRLRRAPDATGQVTLYQDGAPLLDLQNVVTDDTDFNQWYVGNLASALAPPDSTVYVDDVSISAVP